MTRTGGGGGTLIDLLNVPFAANEMDSQYHLFASGIDTSAEVGLLPWMDGSGAFGWKNPDNPYLFGGPEGMRQVAKDHNMILLAPLAPPPGDADGDNCWYNESTAPTAAEKSDWLRLLVESIFQQYDIERDRIAIGGYSSGAQGVTRWFIPRHGAAVMTGGVFVAVGYGGAPAASAGAPHFPQAFKDAVYGHWNTGTNDSAYTTASYGALGGYNWYSTNGFRASEEWPAGVGHARDGQFGGIMRKQIATHVRPAKEVDVAAAPIPLSYAPGTYVRLDYFRTLVR